MFLPDVPIQKKTMQKFEYKLYRDELNYIRNLDYIVNMIKAEAGAQTHKWGIQSRTLPEWFLYTAEEFGEFSEAISEYIYRHGNACDIIREAIQTMTLCAKIIDMLINQDENHELVGNNAH